MSVRLLHLSDIHFGGYGPVWDEDDDQRDEVLADVSGLVERGGEIDGILVGGDVAYSGRREQYEKAHHWLNELIRICGCSAGSVWIVPGNHDIDRARVSDSAILQDFRRTLRSCALDGVDDMLRERLAKDPCCDVLLSPLQSYNDFAFPWGCGVSAHQFYWRDATLRLEEKPILLWGMNSALVSDGDDTGENPDLGTHANMLLGRRQCRVSRAAGAVRIALSHHPPNWLKDWDRVKQYVDRAHLVLFGHEHRLHSEQERPEGTVYIRAGAVGPEQGPEWRPSYNLLTLSIADEKLHIDLEPRVWMDSTPRFGLHEEGEKSFIVKLEDEPEASRAARREPVASDAEVEPANATPLSSPIEEEAQAPAAEAAGRRELVFRYLSAPKTQREAIARKLGVFEPTEQELPDGEFYAAILRRIRDRNLIGDLAKELNA